MVYCSLNGVAEIINDEMKQAIARDDVDDFNSRRKITGTAVYHDNLVEEAGARGALNIMKHIVDKDIWCSHANEEIALLRALENGQIEMAKYLLGRIVNLKCRHLALLKLIVQLKLEDLFAFIIETYTHLPDIKELLLSTACDVGDFKTVKYFVNQGADLSYKDFTPCKVAIKRNDTDILGLIWKNGGAMQDCFSALSYAIECKATEAFGFIFGKSTVQRHVLVFKMNEALVQGADEIFKKYIDFAKPMSDNEVLQLTKTATQWWRHAMLALLLGSLEPSFVYGVSDKLFRDAIDAGSIQAVNEIFRVYNLTPDRGLKVVKMAAREQKFDICRSIMDRIPLQPCLHTTRLIEACQMGHLDTVKFFKEQGVSVDAEGGKGLLAAADAGHLHVVKYLIENQADISVFTPERISNINPRHKHVITYLKQLLCMDEPRCNEVDDDDADGTGRASPPRSQRGRRDRRDNDDEVFFSLPRPVQPAPYCPPLYPPSGFLNLGPRDPHDPYIQPPYPPVHPFRPPNQSRPAKRPKETVSSNIKYLRSQILDRLGDNDECPICLEKLKSIERSTIIFWPKCEHMMCDPCSKEVEICPICRKPYNS